MFPSLSIPLAVAAAQVSGVAPPPEPTPAPAVAEPVGPAVEGPAPIQIQPTGDERPPTSVSAVPS